MARCGFSILPVDALPGIPPPPMPPPLAASSAFCFSYSACALARRLAACLAAFSCSLTFFFTSFACRAAQRLFTNFCISSMESS